MGYYDDLLIALEADDDYDLLANDVEERTFGVKRNTPRESPAPTDGDGPQESGGIINKPEVGEGNEDQGQTQGNEEVVDGEDAGPDAPPPPDSATQEDGEDAEGEEDPEEEDETGDEPEEGAPEGDSQDEQKKLVKEKFCFLYGIVNSNLETLIKNKHSSGFYDLTKYSIIINKFSLLKDNLFKIINDPSYYEKDYSIYLKYFITCNELYTICIKMVEEYFDSIPKIIKDAENSGKRKQSGKNKK